MAVESNNEAILFKIISITLGDSALIWFCQLPERSISGFKAFCAIFMKTYGNHRRHVKTMGDLQKMEQKDDETP